MNGGANFCSVSITALEKKAEPVISIDESDSSENDVGFGDRVVVAVVDFESTIDEGFEKDEKKIIPILPFTRTLKRYNKGDDVLLLQVILNLLNVDNLTKLEEDGDFGSRTEKAVKSFQKFYELEEDGVVGRNTRGALNKRD